EVCFQGSPELQEKVEILRGLLAYKHPNLSLGELFEKLCDLGIEAWDPGRPPKRARRSVPQVAESPAAQQVEAQPPHRHRPLQPKSPAAPRVNASLRRLIWQKARNRRENCHSRHALEIDHRIHRAHGGTNTPENLRLLCRSCNQRAAIQTLGLKKIEPHLDRKN
ncbi:MAG: HNH endonuclease, partial [Bdellovibrionales bacterium]|nr:HNH endonuclease [Bdellovibrionales bacterium]